MSEFITPQFEDLNKFDPPVLVQKKIPNLKVELIAFILLLIIAAGLIYLILNFNSLVEFRELS